MIVRVLNSRYGFIIVIRVAITHEEALLKTIANIEVNIDYPEYEDVEKITIESLRETANYFLSEIEKIEIN